MADCVGNYSHKNASRAATRMLLISDLCLTVLVYRSCRQLLSLFWGLKL